MVEWLALVYWLKKSGILIPDRLNLQIVTNVRHRFTIKTQVTVLP